MCTPAPCAYVQRLFMATSEMRYVALPYMRCTHQVLFLDVMQIKSAFSARRILQFRWSFTGFRFHAQEDCFIIIYGIVRLRLWFFVIYFYVFSERMPYERITFHYSPLDYCIRLTPRQLCNLWNMSWQKLHLQVAHNNRSLIESVNNINR